MNRKIKFYTTLAILVATVILIFANFDALATIYRDYHWFESLGLQSVYIKRLSYELTFKVTGVLFAFLFYFALLVPYLLQRHLMPSNTVLQARADSPGQGVASFFYLLCIGRGVMRPIFLVYLFGAAFISWSFVGPAFASLWESYLLFANSVESPWVDPIFAINTSFYLFDLDFYRSLSFALLLLLFFGTIGIALFGAFYESVIYFASNATEREKISEKRKTTPIIIALLASTFLAILAYLSWIAPYSLIIDGNSAAVTGASYADLFARRYGYYVTSIFLVIAVAFTLFMIIAPNFFSTIASVALSALVWVLATVAYPAMVQTIKVNPNEFGTEEPYIEHTIAYTRIGYDLDRLNRTTFDVGEGMDRGMLDRNQHLMQNIRLWDYRPLRATFKQLQELRLYYEFRDVDVDRYRIDGQLRQVMISPRELNSSSLPSQAQTWIPRHLQYTHGYGVAAAPSNIVTEDGQPELWIKDFPPVSKNLPDVNRPELYFGELTNDYVIVNTSIAEINYPTDDGFAETNYEGSGGVALGRGLRRLLLAWGFDTYKILVSDYIDTNSRILFDRNIHHMVRKIAPFLRFDSDPHIVVGQDGRLYWMMDAYTVSSNFPYSERFAGEYYEPMEGRGMRHLRNANYIRNSVKIVIDAYNGDVSFYAFADEPIINTWRSIFPELFKDISEMPKMLQAHMRYPENFFLLQSILLTDYQMNNAQSFYNREDRWQISQELYDGHRRTVEPYYAVVQLPGESEAETILMLPFQPNNRQNMVAWLAARSDYRSDDESRYGELLLYEFPRARQILGPMQVEARIDQDPDISRDFALWNQQGSRVIRGNLLVLPVEDTLLYIEPIYLQSAEAPFPELRRVIAATGTRLVMRETLDQALSTVVGSSRRASTEVTIDAEGLMTPAVRPRATPTEALEHLNRARRAAGEGNWTRFGTELQSVEELLNEMSRDQ